MTDAESRIRIRRGIFQGNRLSPIWFCLSLNPLSTLLEDSGRGDFSITCDYSNSIRIELGTDKCAVFHVEKGRVANSEGIDLSMPINIRTLSEAERYRYLGMSQNIGVDEVDSDRTERSGQKSPHYYDVPQEASSEIVSNEAVLAAEAWWARIFKRTYHA
ncbi:unnamed protein product [Parnassius mnemosyne]|uniref:Reverse transcriptase domain-containing protein n=1 Tax=Parnassius mnemosyne TaxID=213953 RepID=A0AAV1KHK6_9NEOP